uniref:ATP synthase subunit e, mitochondrial n=1 Tax=Romanomermis culicivorax TaxID=13658 RepID=A0A915HQG3_ROMCU
ALTPVASKRSNQSTFQFNLAGQENFGADFDAVKSSLPFCLPQYSSIGKENRSFPDEKSTNDNNFFAQSKFFINPQLSASTSRTAVTEATLLNHFETPAFNNVLARFLHHQYSLVYSVTPHSLLAFIYVTCLILMFIPADIVPFPSLPWSSAPAKHKMTTSPVHPNAVVLPPPFKVSPFIRACRWGFFTVGVLYGAFRLRQLKKKHNKLRPAEHAAFVAAFEDQQRRKKEESLPKLKAFMLLQITIMIRQLNEPFVNVKFVNEPNFVDEIYL